MAKEVRALLLFLNWKHLLKMHKLKVKYKLNNVKIY